MKSCCLWVQGDSPPDLLLFLDARGDHNNKFVNWGMAIITKEREIKKTPWEVSTYARRNLQLEAARYGFWVDLVAPNSLKNVSSDWEAFSKHTCVLLILKGHVAQYHTHMNKYTQFQKSNHDSEAKT